jgi:hypothetical protein
MDRPSFTFDGKHLALGMASPIRQHEQWFRDQGVPMYVHEPPSGPIFGALREMCEADISDRGFVTSFQNGLRTSPHFRALHLQPGANYGNGETDVTILEKFLSIDIQESTPLLDIHSDETIRPYDFANPAGALKTLVSMAAFCSAKINSALDVGVRQGFSPLADMSPYADFLSAKYRRAVASTPAGKAITAADLSLAIVDELVPSEILGKITIRDTISYRKESESARDAFLEHLLVLQAKLGQIPEGGDYAATITKIITTEVRPAAREFQNKLVTISEKMFGKLAGAAVVAVGSPAAIQIFGDITLEKLASVGATAAFYVAKEIIETMTESRTVRRDCALSYLLDLEK